jgi:hypothetical protein
MRLLVNMVHILGTRLEDLVLIGARKGPKALLLSCVRHNQCRHDMEQPR